MMKMNLLVEKAVKPYSVELSVREFPEVKLAFNFNRITCVFIGRGGGFEGAWPKI